MGQPLVLVTDAEAIATSIGVDPTLLAEHAIKVARLPGRRPVLVIDASELQLWGPEGQVLMEMYLARDMPDE